jgi:hypothetical protein
MMSERLVPTTHQSLKEHRAGISPIQENLRNLREIRNLLHHDRRLYFGADLSRVPEENYPVLLADSINRIEENTNYLNEYKEAGMVEGLRQGLEFQFPDAKVFWGSGETYSRGIAGHYTWNFEIHITDDKPSVREVLHSLARNGRFPDPIRILLHERIHAIQDPDYTESTTKFLFMKFKQKVRDTRMWYAPADLIEAQAYRMGNMPPHETSQQRAIYQMLLYKMTGSYKNISIEKYSYAVQAVDTLNALGLSLSEVAQMVIHPGRWDDRRKCYVHIDEMILQHLANFGLSKDDIPTLLEITKLEKHIDQTRIKYMVREEITSTAYPDGKQSLFARAGEIFQRHISDTKPVIVQRKTK